jgi:hypothetical protein
MRAREFIKKKITESTVESLADNVARAMPAVYVIPELKNQDPYLQYRFGVAMAGSKGAKQRETDGITRLAANTAWGENQIVSAYMDPDTAQDIDYALKQLGMSGKKLISTPKSEEAVDISKTSPVKAFKGYPK